MEKDLKKEDSKKHFDKKILAKKKSLKINHEVCMSIIISYLQIFDTFHHMNEVINVANKEKVDIWSLEEHYNPIETLFLLCKIKDENHKDILFNVFFTKASQRLGDKDFDGRAEEILTQMKNTLCGLSSTQAIA